MLQNHFARAAVLYSHQTLHMDSPRTNGFETQARIRVILCPRLSLYGIRSLRIMPAYDFNGVGTVCDIALGAVRGNLACSRNAPPVIPSEGEDFGTNQMFGMRYGNLGDAVSLPVQYISETISL